MKTMFNWVKIYGSNSSQFLFFYADFITCTNEHTAVGSTRMDIIDAMS
jgi:hypothetical protein